MMQTLALIEMSITCAVALIYLGQQFSHKPFSWTMKWVLLILLGNVFFWPLGLSLELPLAAYVRGMTSDLSVVSILLLWSSILLPSRPLPLGFKWVVMLIALGFYPLALGFGMFDPYTWGYGSVELLVLLLFLALLCAIVGWNKGVWVMAIAIIAWAAHWHESANLWDYVLDPILAIWATISLVHDIYRTRRDKARSGYLFRPG